MKGFAIHNAPTNHGGRIPSTQVRSSQEGNLFVRAGDGHFCPKCKVWSTVQPSHNHVIFVGKPVAYVDDLLSCGARILPQQSHVVGTSGGANLRSSTPVFQPVNYQQNLNSSLVDEKKKNKIYKIYTITKSLTAEKMGEVEARKLGDAHSLSENKFYIYRRNKGLSVVSEETLKRINKEIPINSKYLKQGIAVMGTLSAKYHPNFEDNVYLEFCDKLFTTSLNNIKDRKTAKKIIKEIKDIYGVNVPDSIPETYALYHIYEALVPKTSKGYGYDKIQHFVYNVNSQFNNGYLPTKTAQLGGEVIDIIKGKFSEEIRIDSGNDMDANNNGLAYGEKLSKRYDESIPFRDKK